MNYFQQVLSVVPTCPFLCFWVVLREPWIWMTHTSPEDLLFRHNITIPNRCAGKQVLTRLAGTAGNCQDQHTEQKKKHIYIHYTVPTLCHSAPILFILTCSVQQYTWFCFPHITQCISAEGLISSVCLRACLGRGWGGGEQEGQHLVHLAHKRT